MTTNQTDPTKRFEWSLFKRLLSAPETLKKLLRAATELEEKDAAVHSFEAALGWSSGAARPSEVNSLRVTPGMAVVHRSRGAAILKSVDIEQKKPYVVEFEGGEEHAYSHAQLREKFAGLEALVPLKLEPAARLTDWAERMHGRHEVAARRRRQMAALETTTRQLRHAEAHADENHAKLDELTRSHDSLTEALNEAVAQGEALEAQIRLYSYGLI